MKLVLHSPGGHFDINETTGKQTVDEFSSQFGSASCEFFKCDVTDSQQLKGIMGSQQVREVMLCDCRGRQHSSFMTRSPSLTVMSAQVQLASLLLYCPVDCYNKVEMFGKVSLVGNVAGILMEENWSKMIDINLVS